MFLTSSEVGRWLERESPSQVKVGVGCSGRDKFGQNDRILDVHTAYPEDAMGGATWLWFSNSLGLKRTNKNTQISVQS